MNEKRLEKLHLISLLPSTKLVQHLFGTEALINYESHCIFKRCIITHLTFLLSLPLLALLVLVRTLFPTRPCLLYTSDAADE